MAACTEDVMEKKLKPLGIYIHIPFCVKKCNYCDFLSMPAGKSEKADYIDALIKEIGGHGKKYGCTDTEYRVETVYIGGGTPSCIDVSHVDRILRCIDSEFVHADEKEREITIEVNPGTVTDGMLKTYRDLGIDRLSIGLQSANDNELRALGRIHDTAAFLRTYDAAREAGFENINVDIMTAIPEQTERSLSHTLDIVTDLRPEHVSAYSLIIEEDTPFFKLYGAEEKRPFGEDEERLMYHMTVKRLKECGYERYEISNFAKKGFSSRHNTGYWERKDYFGFGLGASSLIGNVRYKNTSDLKSYVNQPTASGLFEEKTVLGRDDCMDEFMFLGLRMSRGVSVSRFEQEFGVKPKDIYPREIERFIKDGLLKEEDGYLRLTDKGIDYGNHVFAGFLR